MKAANLCTACSQDFHSVSAFDKHWVGRYPQTGPAEYTDRLEQGLVPTDEEWRPIPPVRPPLPHPQRDARHGYAAGQERQVASARARDASVGK
jgi:hypothetical protein